MSSLGSENLRIPHTGMVLSKSDRKIPAAAIAAEDAELIARLAKRGTVVMRLVLTPQTLPSATSYNVIADWKGSDHPEQVVIVSGHLDSWDLGTGAVDDGAGGCYCHGSDPVAAFSRDSSATDHPFCCVDE